MSFAKKNSVLKKFIVFIIFCFSVILNTENSQAGSVSNWFKGLAEVKNPKQPKNTFYISLGYSNATNITSKAYDNNNNLIAKGNGKTSGGSGFNLSIGYRRNIETSLGKFFISPEITLHHLNAGTYNKLKVGEEEFPVMTGSNNRPDATKYYDKVSVGQIISFGVRFGMVFYDRFLPYVKVSLPAMMVNNYSKADAMGSFGYSFGLGIGIEFNIATNLFARLEYNHYIMFKSSKVYYSENVGLPPMRYKQNVGVLSLSLGLNFNVDDL